MAEHLASIFGTEKDRVNCPFYFKIGACRHGDRCSRLHNKPTASQTLLFTNMYQSPEAAALLTVGPDGKPLPPPDPKLVQQHFEDFYEDIFEELSKYGTVEVLAVCENQADHMIGNTYAKFSDFDEAAAALQALRGRYYAGRPILADFSPVTDFREATCRQFEEHTCNRGGYCNFMHLKKPSRELRKRLFGVYESRSSRDRSRSRSPRRYDRGYDDRRGAHGRGGYGRDYDRGGRGHYHDDRGDRPYEERYDRRGRRERSVSPRREREGSAERRAKIAAWNRERDGGPTNGPQNGYAPPPPPPYLNYPPPPPYQGQY